MKKHLIIAGIICSASIPPAYAVTKCVAFTASSSCTVSATSGSSNTDFNGRCGGVPISGVAVCSSTGPTTPKTGTTQKTVNVSESGAFCFCKMTVPAVSDWTMAWYGGTCPADGCVEKCSTAFKSADFKQGMFGSFEN